MDVSVMSFVARARESVRAASRSTERLRADVSLPRRPKKRRKKQRHFLAIFLQKSRDIPRERMGGSRQKPPYRKNREKRPSRETIDNGRGRTRVRGADGHRARAVAPGDARGRAQTCGACRGVDFREIARQRGRSAGAGERNDAA